ncbi:carbohydrate-binding module family 13 protein [Tulasnella calospora MUT 4182]|uniref:Carbohydrate-binding module family 13 protein n=1 Tax=Tulasnella calospora MUT 4182 TaxID=1051891 RepID=A0A0C3KNT4_9AGAM|nr:carbohydrate-binding module family 13 protein [Tulasnella calospora MUT 4182]
MEIEGLSRSKGSDGQATQLREGLYFLVNKKSRTSLDVNAGNGVRVQGYEPNLDNNIGNQMWAITKERLNDTHTLINIQHGTYLDLQGGLRNNGSAVISSAWQLDNQSRSNQEWRIEEREPDYFVIQCSSTDSYLELPGGSPQNSTLATCSQAAEQMDHQLWSLDLISRSALDIKMMLKSWKPDIEPRLFLSHGDSVQYFVLPNQIRRDIWKGTGLLRQPLRPHFFDDDSFVTRMKDAVTYWARDRFQANIRGYSVLWGMIYGETRKGPRAYNWYLSPDLFSLVFFDAQSGKEYGLAALDSFGFEPTLALF